MAAEKKKKSGIKRTVLPKGYEPARSALDGFFLREAGNTCEGILRGSFVIQGKFGPKTVYRLEVAKGETTTSEGEKVGPGGSIGIDETGYTKSLADMAIGTKVFVAYDGKEEDETDAKGKVVKNGAHLFTVGRA